MNTLRLHLSHLEHNYKVIRSLLQPKTDFIAVVKANAYGGGAVEMAKQLEKLGVNALAVAYAEEGKVLRNAGIKLPILVFYPQTEGLNTLLEFGLEPCLYSVNLLVAFRALLQKHQRDSYAVHIKYNTGLNRVGFSQEQTPWLLEQLEESPLRLKSVYSHLAAAEAPKEEGLSKRQIQAFLAIKKQYERSLEEPPKFHLLNSSGLFNYPEHQLDAVRCGIALHGFANKKIWDQKLKPFASLTSKISQIHPIKKGDFVGYDLGWKAQKDGTIATLPIGHADGIGRQFGHGKAQVRIGNSYVSTVGNICMDMLMLDISGTDCKEGDEVVFFDETTSAANFAEGGATLSYEVLTSLGNRIERIIES